MIELAYHTLKSYGFHTRYILSAREVAFSVYKNKNRQKVPYIWKPFIKLDNQAYGLNYLLLRVPAAPRRFIFLALQGSDYHLSFVDDPLPKRGSVIITEHTVIIAFSKETPTIELRGHMGIDINERNVTVSATGGYGHRFDGLAEISEIKDRYREVRGENRESHWRR